MSASLIGQRIGDYEIVARLGTGGMGAVFEAKHPVIGKRVAVKVLHPAFASDPKAIERFINEARVVNAIGHPAIVDIFSFGQTRDGLHYFLMEFLKGRSLADVLEKDGAQPMGLALGLIAQLLEVLQKAHAAGVVHRDLKPHNLFVQDGPSGPRLRVLDFGIAKSMTPEQRQQLTGSAILGTPGYMAPEQINSEPVTPRTDLFATGAVLFELLTGRPIFVGKNVGQMLIKALHEDAPRASTLKPDVPPELDALVARLLARDPSGRPSSAAEALDEVRAVQARLTAQGSTPTRGELPATQPPALADADVRPTGESKTLRPRVSMHEVGQRTEPAFNPEVPGRLSSSSRPPGDDSTRPVPRVKSHPGRPAPAMHEAVATAIDRELVGRMQVAADAAPKRGWAGWLLGGVLGLGALGALAWFVLR